MWLVQSCFEKFVRVWRMRSGRYIRKERMERVGSFKRIAGAWLFDDLRSARWSGYTGICLMFYTLMFPARSGSETGLIVEVRCDVVC